jgi:hypothetical protein
MFFSTLPTVAEGFPLKIWRGGPQVGELKLPPVARGLVDRGLTYLSRCGGLMVPDGAPTRFHPHCQNGARDLPGGLEYWPAMLALMMERTTYRIGHFYCRTGLQRRDDHARQCRAEAEDDLGNLGCCAPRTRRGRGRALGIADGFENALTAMRLNALTAMQLIANPRITA